MRHKDARAIHAYIVAARCEVGRATIYTDGCCAPDGSGGWGFIIRIGKLGDIEHYGGASETSKSRMEMIALLTAMQALPQGITGTIHLDNEVLLNGVKIWMHGWKKNGWRKADGGDIKNLDIWQQIYEARFRRSFEYRWMKTHPGNKDHRIAEMGRQAHLAGEVTAIEIPAAVMPSAAAPPPRLAV